MRSHRKYRDMKKVLTLILMTVAILLAISSCATVSKEPLGPGELRLLSMDVSENGNLKTSVAYWVSVNFQADGRPEIRRACFSWSGDGPYCVRVKDVKYGSDAYVGYRFTLVLVKIDWNVMLNMFEVVRYDGLIPWFLLSMDFDTLKKMQLLYIPIQPLTIFISQ